MNNEIENIIQNTNDFIDISDIDEGNVVCIVNESAICFQTMPQIDPTVKGEQMEEYPEI